MQERIDEYLLKEYTCLGKFQTLPVPVILTTKGKIHVISRIKWYRHIVETHDFYKSNFVQDHHQSTLLICGLNVELKSI